MSDTLALTELLTPKPLKIRSADRPLPLQEDDARGA
ncbi:hypothetical protein HNQ08_002667 [Deinococcus humi]|uniref:Uncharacterized protein n=1 Tax=Deinococcus humi TaxID=662880 RepID=A0A7W8JUU1_9DEIO|nr:hypothetical protein [Deinococcus humi]